MSEQPLCLNCGAAVNGNFCGECGQRLGEQGVSLRDWLTSAVAAAMDLDGRLLRTLRLCVTAPGRLARDYDSARRVGYQSPLRLYFIVSAPIIALMALSGAFNVPLDEETSAALGIAGREQALSNTFALLFPLVNATSPFWTALALKLLSPKYLLQQHLTLSLYYFAGVYIVTLPAAIDYSHWLSGTFIVAVCVGYAVYAFSQFYEWSKPGLVLRSLAFFVVLFLIVLIETWVVIFGGTLIVNLGQPPS